MENNKLFIYRYSAAENSEVERIRKKYLPTEERKIDRLRRLDNRVQTAGMLQSLTVGVIGCLVFGIGMCFGLDVFAGADWVTLMFCGIGGAFMIPAYPIYRHIAKKTRSRLAPEIIRLSDEIIKLRE